MLLYNSNAMCGFSPFWNVFSPEAYQPTITAAIFSWEHQITDLFCHWNFYELHLQGKCWKKLAFHFFLKSWHWEAEVKVILKPKSGWGNIIILMSSFATWIQHSCSRLTSSELRASLVSQVSRLELRNSLYHFTTIDIWTSIFHFPAFDTT